MDVDVVAAYEFRGRREVVLMHGSAQLKRCPASHAWPLNSMFQLPARRINAGGVKELVRATNSGLATVGTEPDRGR
jgi:hypothetical protein